MVFINRHSFLLAGVMGVVLASLLSALLRFSVISLGVILIVILVFVLLFNRMGAGGSSHKRSQPVLDLIGHGLPVLLMFQSAY